MAAIYCIGRNYKKHAEELGNAIPTEPMIFLSSPIALRPLKEGDLAFSNETFHYEAELVLRIGYDHHLGEKFNKNSIESLSFGIDLTRRVEQTRLKEKGHPWTTSKSFLGSKPLGDFYPISQFKNLKKIKYNFYVEGSLRQAGNTENMIFSIEDIINHFNSFSPLKKGDLIFTGTPEGVGEIKKGVKFKFEFTELNIIEEGKL